MRHVFLPNMLRDATLIGTHSSASSRQLLARLTLPALASPRLKIEFTGVDVPDISTQELKTRSDLSRRRIKEVGQVTKDTK